MWYIYQSTTRTSANLNADAYPVPEFCDPTSAAPFTGTNGYNEPIKFLAAKVIDQKSVLMPDHTREDYEAAIAGGENVGDFVVAPQRIRP